MNEYLLTYRQTLRVMYEANPSDLKPEARGRQRRFRVRADEHIAASGLSVDDALYTLFGGSSGEREFRAHGLDPIMRRFGSIADGGRT